MSRKLDRSIETSDRCHPEGLISSESLDMEPALESDRFVVTGVSVSREIGASNPSVRETPVP